MRDRIRSNNPECWNKEAIKNYADSEKKKLDRGALTDNLNISEGFITCSGCVGGECTAQIFRTRVQRLGQNHQTVGFKDTKDIPGFELDNPNTLEEGEVIDLRDLAA